MRVPLPILAGLSIAILAAGAAWLWLGAPAQQGPSLQVNCAAGLQIPMTRIAEKYRRETGVVVQVIFDGSGTLLASMRASGKGDLFIAADRQYIAQAEEFGLIAQQIPIASQRPVLAVARGNPKGITSLADLARPEIRLSLPNPATAAIGKVAQAALQPATLKGRPAWDLLVEKALAIRDTVNGVANDLRTGTADAGILWDTTARQYPELDWISLPEFGAHEGRIAMAVLKSSPDRAAAEHFAQYIVAPEGGLEVWRQSGYHVVR